MTDRNIAVVGAGYWGKNLVRNFAELGALHTICDANPRTLQEAASRYADAETQPDYRRVLDDAAIQGVVIATPAAQHYPMARDALLAGKDVFVEKPLALSVHEGAELVELAGNSGRVLLVGHLLEYHPALDVLRQMVNSGELGKVQYIYSNRLNLGHFRTEENILWSFAPHDIAAILGLLGDEMPTHVSAHGGSYLSRGIADVTLSTLTFASEARAHIFVSWLHPFKEQRLVVVGDRRMAEFADTDPTDKLRVYDHRISWVDRMPQPVPGEARPVPFPGDEPLRLECLDFLRSIEDRSSPKSDGSRALQVLKVLTACQESLENGGALVRPNHSLADYFAHASSVIEQTAQIGSGSKIWHFAHVMPGAVIGQGCTLGQNVFIGSNVRLGSNVKVENNVSVFEGVTLEDDVFCGPSCVFTNVINPRSHVSRKHEFRPTLVRKGATIGANAVIVCGHTVGRYAFVGAASVVTQDVPDFALVYGNPARRAGWMCACGVRLSQEEHGLHCPACGARYACEGPDTITPLEENAYADTTD